MTESNVSDGEIGAGKAWFDENFNGCPDTETLVEGILRAAAKVRASREGGGAIEALKPFADAAHMIGEDMDDDYAPEWSPFITARAYRNAAKALAAIPATGGEKE